MTAYSWDEVLEVVRKNIYEVVPESDGRAIDLDDLLADLGANSVDRAEILTLSMEALSIAVPRSQMAGSSSVRELVDGLRDAATRP
jgi:polyketide biosynthesis acyl carrier protein